MQHVKPLLSLVSLAALVSMASAETSPEAAYEQLHAALGREVELLASMQDAASATAALPQLREVLQELASMDRSYDAEKELWQYIDNTAGKKLPLIELLQRLTIQFARLQDASFYKNSELFSLLRLQLRASHKEAPAAN